MEDSWKTAHADLLKALSSREMAGLLKCAGRRRIGRGAPVFEAGQESGEIFIVNSGLIKLYQLSPGGKEIILRFAFPGELFGVAESIRRVPREISATAKVASEVLAIDRRDFVAFLRSHPEAALRAIGILSARIRTLGFSLVELTADDVEMRLARLLLRFSAGTLCPPCSTSRRPGEVCMNFDLTRTDMANLVGASRQTVTTMLARLQRDGIVRAVGRHLHLPEPPRLARLCEKRIG
jgi:CRP-like cAMP-binding protein